jgi:hypothetical protein
MEVYNYKYPCNIKHLAGAIVLYLRFKETIMEPVIIKLDLAGTTVHINANQILYYYAKQNKDGQVVTQLFFTEKFGLEVSETPAEIDALVKNKKPVALINTGENVDA